VDLNLISYHYSSLIREKQEQILKLQRASSELTSFQGELGQLGPNLLKPSLQGETWMGQLASKFEEGREEIQSAFKELESEQFSEVFQSISIKIIQLQNEIERLQNQLQIMQLQLQK
jgi:Domain of unknown function (DUF5082)